MASTARNWRRWSSIFALAARQRPQTAAFIRSCSSATELGANINDYDRGHDLSFLRKQLEEIVGSSKAFSDGLANREQLLNNLPKSQNELVAKSMKEGLQVAWLKLSVPAVREKHVNIMTNVRIGRILEDLDIFAVWISFMHNNAGNDIQALKSPLIIVTAVVDQIDMKQKEIRAYRLTHAGIRLVGRLYFHGDYHETSATTSVDGDGAL